MAVSHVYIIQQAFLPVSPEISTAFQVFFLNNQKGVLFNNQKYGTLNFLNGYSVKND